MKRKAKTQAQVRREQKISAEEKRNREILKAAEAEAEALAQSKQVYQDIWRAFSENREKGASHAYALLMNDLTKFASHLVPNIMSAKEHMALIAEAESHIKGEGHSSGEDPRVLVARWIRGEIDLSRTPLEKQVAH